MSKTSSVCSVQPAQIPCRRLGMVTALCSTIPAMLWPNMTKVGCSPLCSAHLTHCSYLSQTEQVKKKNATVAANCLAHAWLLERVFKHAVSCWRELQRFLTAAPLVSKISLTARILFFQRGSLNLILFIYTPSLLLSSSTGRVWVGNNYFCLLMFIASE